MTKEIPKVSIVIACFNDIDVIKAVQSAFDQTYPSKEIILVDDGSNEQTKAVISDIKGKINILLTQENQGQSIARNNGIKAATGDFILNLDADDYFEDTFTEKAVEKFLQDDDIKIVTCQAEIFSKTGRVNLFTPKGGELQDFLFSNSALGSAMFKKEDWGRIGGYEEKLPILGFEDWEFFLRLLKCGGYAYVIKEVLFHYQIKKDSTTKQIQHLREEKFQHIIFKHKDLYIENFDLLIPNLFRRIKKAESEKRKRISSKEYTLGNNFLKPLRLLRSVFKRKNN